MNNEWLEVYKSIMHDLTVLPESIREAQDEVTELRLRIGDVEKDMAQLEPDLMAQADGKNAEARKAALLKLKATNPTWQRYEQTLSNLQRDLATANDDLDYRTRVYNATAYRSRLHASLLQYLSAGGQPIVPTNGNGDVDFGMNGRATVTADDAKEIGL